MCIELEVVLACPLDVCRVCSATDIGEGASLFALSFLLDICPFFHLFKGRALFCWLLSVIVLGFRLATLTLLLTLLLLTLLWQGKGLGHTSRLPGGLQVQGPS